MYFAKTPLLIQSVFTNFLWRIPTTEKVLYLTFDDGPIPKVTPWVMQQLSVYKAKASFFCVGENIQKHPAIFDAVVQAGHQVGNHTHHHVNGWKTPTATYLQEVALCAQHLSSRLFRPPYGRLRPAQVSRLRPTYQLVMWDVLSGDFDPHISSEKVYQNVIQHTQPGSIIVFHDSLKAERHLRYALPKVLHYFSEKGYRFDKLPMP